MYKNFAPRTFRSFEKTCHINILKNITYRAGWKVPANTCTRRTVCVPARMSTSTLSVLHNCISAVQYTLQTTPVSSLRWKLPYSMYKLHPVSSLGWTSVRSSTHYTPLQSPASGGSVRTVLEVQEPGAYFEFSARTVHRVLKYGLVYGSVFTPVHAYDVR